jgi:hypothetical protein
MFVCFCLFVQSCLFYCSSLGLRLNGGHNEPASGDSQNPGRRRRRKTGRQLGRPSALAALGGQPPTTPLPCPALHVPARARAQGGLQGGCWGQRGGSGPCDSRFVCFFKTKTKRLNWLVPLSTKLGEHLYVLKGIDGH